MFIPAVIGAIDYFRRADAESQRQKNSDLLATFLQKMTAPGTPGTPGTPASPGTLSTPGDLLAPAGQAPFQTPQPDAPAPAGNNLRSLIASMQQGAAPTQASGPFATPAPMSQDIVYAPGSAGTPPTPPSPGGAYAGTPLSAAFGDMSHQEISDLIATGALSGVIGGMGTDLLKASGGQAGRPLIMPGKMVAAAAGVDPAVLAGAVFANTPEGVKMLVPPTKRETTVVGKSLVDKDTGNIIYQDAPEATDALKGAAGWQVEQGLAARAAGVSLDTNFPGPPTMRDWVNKLSPEEASNVIAANKSGGMMIETTGPNGQVTRVMTNARGVPGGGQTSYDTTEGKAVAETLNKQAIDAQAAAKQIQTVQAIGGMLQGQQTGPLFGAENKASQYLLSFPGAKKLLAALGEDPNAAEAAVAKGSIASKLANGLTVKVLETMRPASDTDLKIAQMLSDPANMLPTARDAYINILVRAQQQQINMTRVGAAYAAHQRQLGLPPTQQGLIDIQQRYLAEHPVFTPDLLQQVFGPGGVPAQEAAPQ